MKRRLFAIVRLMLLALPGGRSLYERVSNWREGRRKIRDRRILQKSGPDLLRLVHLRLHGKVPYFIDYGTLLGCMRDGGFIKHDDDVDFGLMPGADLRKLITLFEGTELEYLGGYVYDGAVREIGFSFRKMRVDFFVNSEFGDTFQTDEYYDIPGKRYQKNETGCYRFTRPRVTAIVERKFVGTMVDVPENFEDLLVAHYGSNWRNPDPNWKSSDGDGKYRRVQMPIPGRYAVSKKEVLSLC